jgi:uroporphyrinogen decarboxylase
VPEPNTWRELLQTIDANVPVANQTVALQEYGITNPSLIAGLEARGADVLRLQVYRWELPEDEQPLRDNVRAFAEGRLDVLLFTAAVQVTHVVQMAEQMGLADSVQDRLARR